MIRKYCPLCLTYSYSASTKSPWLCATCQLDLSAEPFLQIDEKAAADTEQNDQKIPLIISESGFSQ